MNFALRIKRVGVRISSGAPNSLFYTAAGQREATEEDRIRQSRWILSITLSINRVHTSPRLAGSRLPAIVLRDRLRQQIQANRTSRTNVTLGRAVSGLTSIGASVPSGTGEGRNVGAIGVGPTNAVRDAIGQDWSS